MASSESCLETVCVPNQSLPQIQGSLSSPKAIVADYVSAPPISPRPLPFPCRLCLSIACHSLLKSYLWLQNCSLAQWVGCAGGFDASSSSPQPLAKQVGGTPSPLGDDNSEKCALHCLPSFCRGLSPSCPQKQPGR